MVLKDLQNNGVYSKLNKVRGKYNECMFEIEKYK